MVQIGESFRLLPGADEAARNLLAGRPATIERIDRVMDLTTGFESANSRELLATVHWIALHPNAIGRSDDEIADEVRPWSKRNARLFTSGQIHKALYTLHEKDWLTTPAL